MNVWYWIGAACWLICGLVIGAALGWRARNRWADACQHTGIEDQ